MWARAYLTETKRSKHHYYTPPVVEGCHGYAMTRPLCGGGLRLYNYWLWENGVRQPRHADRCKRCVAALERREDENA